MNKYWTEEDENSFCATLPKELPVGLFDMMELIRTQREKIDADQAKIGYDPVGHRQNWVNRRLQFIEELETKLEAKLRWTR